jgi:hypothetical protein
MTIIETARQYVGIKEKPPNKGFSDIAFEKSMKAIGWKKYWSWCMMFQKLIHTECYFGTPKEKYLKYFSPNCQQTFRNFMKFAPELILTAPEEGAMIIWKTGKFTGHVGIISGSDLTIEGNRNDICQEAFRNLTKSTKKFEVLGYVKF